MVAQLSKGSSSQPRRAPFAMYSSIFAWTSERRSDGDRSSITKSGQTDASFSCCLFRNPVPSLARHPGGIRASLCAIRQRESRVGAETDARSILFAPIRQALNNDEISPTCLRSCRRHDDQLSLRAHFDSKVAIVATKAQKLIIRQA